MTQHVESLKKMDAAERALWMENIIYNITLHSRSLDDEELSAHEKIVIYKAYNELVHKLVLQNINARLQLAPKQTDQQFVQWLFSMAEAFGMDAERLLRQHHTPETTSHAVDPLGSVDV